ncbi:hypothetical protein FACS1894167_14930 [Synergistales bacterium]|nr:hypothetical protein FACS1894167_14930 [Synergistales bacterium]
MIAQTAGSISAERQDLHRLIDVLPDRAIYKITGYIERMREEDDAEFEAIGAEIAALEAKYGTTPNAKLRASIEELRAGGGIEFSSAEDVMAYLNDDSDDQTF